jgi:hypothetical protein
MKKGQLFKQIKGTTQPGELINAPFPIRRESSGAARHSIHKFTFLFKTSLAPLYDC